MKNTQQKGSAALIIIIIVLLGIICWMYFKKQQVPSAESLPAKEVSTGINTGSTSVSQDTLTDQDILGATYTLSANFDGKKTSPQKVKLPYLPENEFSAQQSKDRVYITKEGSVVKEWEAGSEMFYISSYKLDSSNPSNATVDVTGSFGASGYDNRVFTVTKVNGQVTTQEK